MCGGAFGAQMGDFNTSTPMRDSSAGGNNHVFAATTITDRIATIVCLARMMN